MAKKKAAISDLIKSDMSRRTIGEEPKTTKETELFLDERPVKKPSEKKPVEAKTAPPAPKAAPVSEAVAASADKSAIPEESANLMAFIAEQAKSVELTDKTDLHNFYAFLQNQAMRYIRGIDAGRRFHG
jgi:hypothetical protein